MFRSLLVLRLRRETRDFPPVFSTQARSTSIFSVCRRRIDLFSREASNAMLLLCLWHKTDALRSIVDVEMEKL